MESTLYRARGCVKREFSAKIAYLPAPLALWSESPPAVFTRHWKIGMSVYRRLEKDPQLAEFKCVEYAEELLYGDLRKK
jgi:hypothetical protein